MKIDDMSNEELAKLVPIKCPKCGNDSLSITQDRSVCEFCFAAMKDENSKEYPPTDNGEVSVPTSRETEKE